MLSPGILWFFYLVVIFVVFFIIQYLTEWIFHLDTTANTVKLREKSQYRLADNYVALPGNSDGILNCTLNEKLIPCQLDDENNVCDGCKQVYATCVHIDNDVYSDDGQTVLIPANKEANEGYCLPHKLAAESCSRRHGGKWILTTSNDNRDEILYTFECLCSTPNFFVNNPEDGNNCTLFVGCSGGKMKNPDTWRTYDDIECECGPQDKAVPGQPPYCAPLNIYLRQYTNDDEPFSVIPANYLDPAYRVLLTVDDKTVDSYTLPDPCTFDVVTRTYIRGIGKIQYDKTTNTCFCVSTNSNYMTTILNDDYLLNNGGKYANAMMKIRINSEDGEETSNVYEIQRKGAEQSTLVGVRVRYTNYPIKLPYLESESFNMGNKYGFNYQLFPTIPKERQSFAYVYCYEAMTPNSSNIIVPQGHHITYVPTFMSDGIDSRYRVYNGCIAHVDVPAYEPKNKQGYMMIYPIPPATEYKSIYGTTGIMGSLTSPDVNSGKFVSTYAMPMVGKNDNFEIYSRLFTGTVFVYTINGKVYMRPVSCGIETLTQKYRLNVDPKWRSSEEQVKGLSGSKPLEMAQSKRDGHMFTHTSYGVERNGIGVAAQQFARYTFDQDDNVIFPTYYS